ncbi:MAG: hypothetical protein Q4A52_00495 [Bacillota bacterium]|nr:hypothetical protein [Bacillota bacterium]
MKKLLTPLLILMLLLASCTQAPVTDPTKENDPSASQDATKPQGTSASQGATTPTDKNLPTTEASKPTTSDSPRIPLSQADEFALVRRMTGVYSSSYQGTQEGLPDFDQLEVHYIGGHLLFEFYETYSNGDERAILQELVPDDPVLLLSKDATSFTAKTVSFIGYTTESDMPDESIMESKVEVTLRENELQLRYEGEEMIFSYALDPGARSLHWLDPEDEAYIPDWEPEMARDLIGTWVSEPGTRGDGTRTVVVMEEDGSMVFLHREEDKPLVVYRGVYRVDNDNTLYARIERLGYGETSQDLDMAYHLSRNNSKLELLSVSKLLPIPQELKLVRSEPDYSLASRYVAKMNARAYTFDPNLLIGCWEGNTFNKGEGRRSMVEANFFSRLLIDGSDYEHLRGQLFHEVETDQVEADDVEFEFVRNLLVEGISNPDWYYRMSYTGAQDMLAMTLVDEETILLFWYTPEGIKYQIEYKRCLNRPN